MVIWLFVDMVIWLFVDMVIWLFDVSTSAHSKLRLEHLVTFDSAT